MNTAGFMKLTSYANYSKTAITGLVTRALPAPLLGGGFRREAVFEQAAAGVRRLDGWLGVGEFTRRDWAGRLPAVALAGSILTGYAWLAGLPPLDLRWALVLALAAAALGRFSDSN
jgi:hypothetical protein